MVNLGKRASVETNVVKKKEEKFSDKRARWEKSQGGSGITIPEKSGENKSYRKFSKTLSEITRKQLDENKEKDPVENKRMLRELTLMIMRRMMTLQKKWVV